MSQIGTRLLASLTLFGIFMATLPAHAGGTPVTDCIRQKLLEAKVPINMQSIYNPNTFVGKLTIQIAQQCMQMSENQNKQAPTVVPASFDSGGDNAAAVSERGT